MSKDIKEVKQSAEAAIEAILDDTKRKGFRVYRVQLLASGEKSQVNLVQDERGSQ